MITFLTGLSLAAISSRAVARLSGLQTDGRYIALPEDVIYIATTRVTNMPQAENLPPIDVTVQKQTITFDFGAGPYLPAGVTLIGLPTCSLELEWGDDPDPSSRILVAGLIGTAPKPYGSGRTDTAVLLRIGTFPGQSGYLAKCYCERSDGDVASMDVKFLSRVPGS